MPNLEFFKLEAGGYREKVIDRSGRGAVGTPLVRVTRSLLRYVSLKCPPSG